MHLGAYVGVDITSDELVDFLLRQRFLLEMHELIIQLNKAIKSEKYLPQIAKLINQVEGRQPPTQDEIEQRWKKGTDVIGTNRKLVLYILVGDNPQLIGTPMWKRMVDYLIFFNDSQPILEEFKCLIEVPFRIEHSLNEKLLDDFLDGYKKWLNGQLPKSELDKRWRKLNDEIDTVPIEYVFSKPIVELNPQLKRKAKQFRKTKGLNLEKELAKLTKKIINKELNF